MYFYCEGATTVSISAAGAAVTLGATTGTNTVNTTVTAGNTSAGVPQGSTSTVTWTATYTVNGKTMTAKAYSVCYAPFLSPVGTAIRMYNDDGTVAGYKHDTQGLAYVSGVHSSATTGERNFKLSGNYHVAPLLGSVSNPNGSDRPVTEYLEGSIGTVGLREWQGGDDKRTEIYNSPMAQLRVDSSRYTNLNQIPNLTCGMVMTHLNNVNDSYRYYLSDFNATNDGWNYNNTSSTDNNFQNRVFRDVEYPVIFHGSNETEQTKTASIVYGGQSGGNVWSQPLSSDNGTQLMRLKAASWGENDTEYNCLIMYVNTTVTRSNKSALRAAVREHIGYGLQAVDHTPVSWNAFETARESGGREFGRSYGGTNYHRNTDQRA